MAEAQGINVGEVNFKATIDFGEARRKVDQFFAEQSNRFQSLGGGGGGVIGAGVGGGGYAGGGGGNGQGYLPNGSRAGGGVEYVTDPVGNRTDRTNPRLLSRGVFFQGIFGAMELGRGIVAGGRADAIDRRSNNAEEQLQARLQQINQLQGGFFGSVVGAFAQGASVNNNPGILGSLIRAIPGVGMLGQATAGLENAQDDAARALRNEGEYAKRLAAERALSSSTRDTLNQRELVGQRDPFRNAMLKSSLAFESTMADLDDLQQRLPSGSRAKIDVARRAANILYNVQVEDTQNSIVRARRRLNASEAGNRLREQGMFGRAEEADFDAAQDIALLEAPVSIRDSVERSNRFLRAARNGINANRTMALAASTEGCRRRLTHHGTDALRLENESRTRGLIATSSGDQDDDAIFGGYYLQEQAISRDKRSRLLALRSRADVAGLSAAGKNMSARASEIFSSAVLESDSYVDADERKLALQTGRANLIAFQRTLSDRTAFGRGAQVAAALTDLTGTSTPIPKESLKEALGTTETLLRSIDNKIGKAATASD